MAEHGAQTAGVPAEASQVLVPTSGEGCPAGAEARTRPAALSFWLLVVWAVAGAFAVAGSLAEHPVGSVAGAYLTAQRCNEALWGVLACAALLVAPPLAFGRRPAGTWMANLQLSFGHAVALSAIAMPFGLIASRYHPLPEGAYVKCLLFHAVLLWSALLLYSAFSSAYWVVCGVAAGGMPLAAYLIAEMRLITPAGAASSGGTAGAVVGHLLSYAPVSGAIWPLRTTTATHEAAGSWYPIAAYALLGLLVVAWQVVRDRRREGRLEGVGRAPRI